MGGCGRSGPRSSWPWRPWRLPAAGRSSWRRSVRSPRWLPTRPLPPRPSARRRRPPRRSRRRTGERRPRPSGVVVPVRRHTSRRLAGGNPLRPDRHRRDDPAADRHGRARRRPRREGDRSDRSAGEQGERPRTRRWWPTPAALSRRPGSRAVLTRTGDYRIAIAPRAAIVAAVKPKAVVSIHHNASSSRLLDKPGTEVFHQAVGAERRRVPPAGRSPLRGGDGHARPLRGDASGRPRRGPGSSPAATPKATTTTASCAGRRARRPRCWRWGSSPTRPEERLYAQPAVQKAVGEAVARGVVRFLTTPDPGSGFINPPRLADDNRSGGGTENCEDPPLG